MKNNMHLIDRIVRVLVSLVFVFLYFTDRVTGTTGLVLLILACVFTVTALFNFCPIYRLIGISTAKKG